MHEKFVSVHLFTLFRAFLQVSYFNYATNAFAAHSDRRHREAVKYLKEDREFAKWSAEDREKRLPKLSPEEQEQLQNYLRIVDKHSIDKAMFMCSDESMNCPMFARSKKKGSASSSINRES